MSASGRPAARLAPPRELVLSARGPTDEPFELVLDGVLLRLPGRALAIGESWTDTLSFDTGVAGMQQKGSVIVQGT